MSLSAFDKVSLSEKLIGPITENQSRLTPIELLILSELLIDES